MAYTLNQYNAICEAIGSGELMVQYDGKKVEFRSINELLKAKANIEAELVGTGLLTPPTAGGGIVRGTTTYAAYDPE